VAEARDPVADLKRIAFLLEAMQEPSYRVRVFRSAAATLARVARRRSPSVPRAAGCVSFRASAR